MLRSTSRNRLWPTLLVVLAICGTLTVLHKRAESASGRSDAATSFVRRVILVPPAHVIEAIKRWSADTVGALFYGPRLARENRALRSQVAELSLSARDLQDQATENIRLRALLAFKARAKEALLPAEVVALKPSALRDTLMLDRGLRDGVRRRMCVLDSSGSLIGQVIDVTDNTCDVMLLTDDLSSVGIETVPQQTPGAKPRKSVIGICQGERSPLIKAIDIPQDADIRPGDGVVASGLGDIYPKDIPVGVVASVATDRATLLKTAEVMPYARFDHLQLALVLLSQQPQDRILNADAPSP